MKWLRLFGGSDQDFARAIEIQNNIIFITGFTKSINFINNNSTRQKEDIFIVTFDNTGNHIWNKLYSGSDTDHACGISVSDESIYILGGTWSADFPMENYKFVKGFDNQQLNDFGGGIAKRPNGELVVAASSRKAEGMMYDSWLLGLDTSGKMIWNKFLGNRFDDIVNKVSISAQNEIYVAGITDAIVDSVKGQAWLYKLDANGKNIFNQRIDIDEVLDFEKLNLAI